MSSLATTMLQRLEESEAPVWAWEGLRRKRRLWNPLSARGDYRVNVRIPTDDPGLMKMLEPSSPVRWLIRVVEVSKDDMAVVAQTRLDAGSLVQIYLKQTSVLALVLRSEPTADSGHFRIRVDIQHVF